MPLLESTHTLFIIACVTALGGSTAMAQSRLGDTIPEAPERRDKPERFRVSITAGGAWSDGNVESLAASGAASLGLVLPGRHEVFVDGRGTFTRFGGNVVADAQSGALLYAWGPSEHINLYFYSTHARNRFQRLDYRTSNSLGVCVHSFAPELFSIVLVSLGLGPEHEQWDDGARELRYRATLRLDFTIPLGELADVGADITYAPRIDAPRDYRIFGDAYVEAKLSPELFKLRVTVANEYDARPRPGVLRNDVRVVPALVLNWSG